MAAGMSFNFSGMGGKFGNSSGNDAEWENSGGDLLVKMSKKIAQLTKVVYALNTKNDEQDVYIQSLREAHEGEVQRVVNDTDGKLHNYRAVATENKRGMEADFCCSQLLSYHPVGDDDDADRVDELAAHCDTLQRCVEQTEAERKRAEEECAGKMEKMKAFYAEEARAAREEALAQKDEHLRMLEQDLEYLHAREGELRAAMDQRVGEVNDRVESLAQQLTHSKEEEATLREEVSSLKEKLNASEEESRKAQQQIKDGLAKKSELECRLKESENEFAQMVEKCAEMDNQLMNKNSK
ncbi:PREDICTED: protein FAM184A-like [Priapulus caudatus]|uniref:Protein FAM184A-like n=1 Tax=Priapulus caudatus TaxID=37621 RepID=A0ABM1EVK6_PRICU|nr:PREDICTED: protein FAM184A-like [Priapulus caudatus]